jgi:hypothetical protein
VILNTKKPLIAERLFLLVIRQLAVTTLFFSAFFSLGFS